ncbi:hypothetical protein GCM10009754_49930 [Amycolatopsis minnesotensis]|uniref:Uncharacterized protein n=2 Tax=Amycolatopsis minnesotensis TaxID=337894 RepID=A0ABP5CWJ8_9PSEU
MLATLFSAAAGASPKPSEKQVTCTGGVAGTPGGSNWRNEDEFPNVKRYYDGSAAVRINCNGPVEAIRVTGLYYYSDGNNVVTGADHFCFNTDHCDGVAFAAALYFSAYINCDKKAVGDYARTAGSYHLPGGPDTVIPSAAEGPKVETRNQLLDPACQNGYKH